MGKSIVVLSNMLRLFFSSMKNLEKLLNNELQFFRISNCFSNNLTHKPNVPYPTVCMINHFNTCQGFLRENIDNIENFNPSKMTIKKDGTVKKKKKNVGVKVYLLNEKGISSSMFLQDAEKLAQHKNLKLQKVEDINGVPAYKLGPNFFETEFPSIKNEKLKGDRIKKLIINEDIKSHDLQVKINHINKFLGKGMKVLVKLGERSSDSSKLTAIYGELEKSLADHNISKLLSKSGYHIEIRPKQKNPNDEKK